MEESTVLKFLAKIYVTIITVNWTIVLNACIHNNDDFVNIPESSENEETTTPKPKNEISIERIEVQGLDKPGMTNNVLCINLFQTKPLIQH